MIKSKNAESTVRAMHSTGWAVYVAGFAVLHSRQSAFDTSEESMYAGMGESGEARFTDLPGHVARVRGGDSAQEERRNELEQSHEDKPDRVMLFK